MEEKIIEARFKKNTLAYIILTVSLFAIVLGCIITYNDYLNGTDWHNYRTLPNKEHYNSFGEYFEHHDNWGDNLHLLWIYGGILGAICSLFLFWLMNACSMTITNSRVIGKASFGKRVDLPTSQISAVGLGFCGMITVATSSGRIHFWLLANREDVHTELAKIISKVQIQDPAANNTPVQNDADELRKYKELLDDGIISQEEFEAKKKQILDL